MATPNCRCSYCLKVNEEYNNSNISREASFRSNKSRGLPDNQQVIKSRGPPLNQEVITSRGLPEVIQTRGIRSRGLVNKNQTNMPIMTATRALPMNANLSAADQIKIANKARRARVWFGCCKGQATDEGVTDVPEFLIYIIALGAGTFDHSFSKDLNLFPVTK